MMDSKSLRFITHQSFFSAVRSGDLASLRELVAKLTEGGQASAEFAVTDLMSLQNDAGETALYVAAENNLQEVFGYLLKYCDVQTVKIRSKADMDAFHVAAERGHLGAFPISALVLWLWISFRVR